MLANADTWREPIELCAQELRSSLRDSEILTPDSKGYGESIKRWSNGVEKKAGVVVLVGSAEDISTTVKLSQSYSVSFVVSGGKHSSSGASSSDGGLVIDLAKMRKVEVDVPAKTVKAQGGCIWEDIDEAAAEHDLAMVGETVNHTEVGGTNAWRRIVLADGSIRMASADENADLFWAVRGAGHCFGVVAEFTFQTYEQKNAIWAGQLLFPASEKLDQVITFANQFLETTNGDSGMVLGITQPPFIQEIAIATTVFHNGNQAEAEVVFKGLLDLKPLRDTTQERPYSKMNSMMNPFVPYGGRKLTKGASFVPLLSADFARTLIKELQDLHSKVPGSLRSVLLFEFFKPDVWCRVPEDATAFANRGKHMNLMIGPFSSEAKDDETVRVWAREIARLSREELERVKDEAGRPAWMEKIGEHGNYDGEAPLHSA